MVGGAAVFVVVGADFLAAIAAAHLRQPDGAFLGIGFRQFAFVELGPEDFHGPLPVLELGAFLGAKHPNPRGLVDQVHSGFHLVHVLTTGTTGAGGAHFDFGGINLHFHRIGLRHHGHRCRGGVHPALGFGGGYPLHPMHPGFKLQLAEHAFALDGQN